MSNEFDPKYFDVSNSLIVKHIVITQLSIDFSSVPFFISYFNTSYSI